ncbi:GNAT family N-acetyltransferase [Trichothermofontia sp.]
MTQFLGTETAITAAGITTVTSTDPILTIARISADHPDFAYAAAIRQQVFQQEQGVDAALDFDGRDRTAQHFLVWAGSRPIGTARLRALNPYTVKVERLAVIPAYRGRGVASQMMLRILQALDCTGVETVILHAQSYVQNLYLKFGFEPIGTPFEEAGIRHIKMQRRSPGIPGTSRMESDVPQTGMTKSGYASLCLTV